MKSDISISIYNSSICSLTAMCDIESNTTVHSKGSLAVHNQHTKKVGEGSYRHYSISRAFERAEATIPAGIETMPRPIHNTKKVNTLPPAVIG